MLLFFQFHNVPLVQATRRQAHDIRQASRWYGHSDSHGADRGGQQGPAH